MANKPTDSTNKAHGAEAASRAKLDQPDPVAGPAVRATDAAKHGRAPAPTDTTSPAHEKELAAASRRARPGNVPNRAVQEQEQVQAAVQQMHGKGQLQINEGGRTNDSREAENPEGAVHGLPKPALKGTWR